MMELNPRYRWPLMMALGLHVLLALFLALDPSSARPVLIEETRQEMGEQTQQDHDLAKNPDVVQAVSVDAAAVEKTMEHLKQQRLDAQKQEQAKQAAAQQAIAKAQALRQAEQKKLAQMKLEEERIAIAHKKAMEEEQKRLKLLKEQQEKEKKALEALKTKQAMVKQQEIAKRLEEKKQQEALALQKKTQQAQDVQRAQEARQRAAEQAAEDAARRARLAGVVDKYKALILNAISRQWILPENISPGLSSQFSIRLAPNGSVLSVTLLRSSGDPILDRSAQTAIYKASPLPVPQEADSFQVFREISLTVRPEQLRG